MANSYDDTNPMLFVGAEDESGQELPVIENEQELPELPEDSNTPGKPKKEKKIKGWRIAVSSVMGVLGILVLCVAVLAGSAFGLLDNIQYIGKGEDSEIDNSALTQDGVEGYTPENLSTLEVRGNNDYVTNYLLVGCDARGNGRGLADTNIILSINDATKTIKMVSIMRDTWVTVPGAGYQAKINATYPYGGFETLLETIEANFCLDIDQAVRVDFKAFSSAIDALGGVDIYVDARAARCIPKENPGNPDIWAVKSGEGEDWYTLVREPIGTTAGTYHLEGFQALAFARLRKIYSDSDYTRVKNQRRLITTVMSTAMQNPTKIFGALSAVLQDVTMYNMSKSDILDYVYNAAKYLDYSIETDYELTYQGSRSQAGASILLLPNQEQQIKDLHAYLYATEKTAATTTAAEQ